MTKTANFLTEFKPGDWGWVMYEGETYWARINSIEVMEEGWYYMVEIPDEHGTKFQTTFFSKHQNPMRGVYRTRQELLDAHGRSYIEGKAKIIFGGSIQISVAKNKINGHSAIMLSELKIQHECGDEITQEEIGEIIDKGQVIMEFSNKKSIDYMHTALMMAEDYLNK